MLYNYIKDKGIKIIDEGVKQGVNYTHKLVTYTKEGIQVMDNGKILDGTKAGIKRTEIFEQAAHKLGTTPVELQQTLWDTYHPNQIWWVMAAVGTVTFILLFIYNKTIGKTKKIKIE